MISHANGKGDSEQIKSLVSNSLSLGIAIGIFLILAGLTVTFFSRFLAINFIDIPFTYIVGGLLIGNGIIITVQGL